MFVCASRHWGRKHQGKPEKQLGGIQVQLRNQEESLNISGGDGECSGIHLQDFVGLRFCVKLYSSSCCIVASGPQGPLQRPTWTTAESRLCQEISSLMSASCTTFDKKA